MHLCPSFPQVLTVVAGRQETLFVLFSIVPIRSTRTRPEKSELLEELMRYGNAALYIVKRPSQRLISKAETNFSR
jgi:hypothetical protein